MMNKGLQPLLFSLVSHFGSGNYAAFERICSIILRDSNEVDKFFCPNLLLAAQVAGIVEIKYNGGLQFWSVATSSDIQINSVVPKMIGVTKAWFDKYSSDTNVLIEDYRSRALILGSNSRPLSMPSIYNDFIKRFPSFREIEKFVCVQEQFNLEFGNNFQVFDLDNRAWISHEISNLKQACLLRSKKEFSGYSYYIISPECRLLFRVVSPDWAFLIAFLLLNWPLEKLVSATNDNISIPRSIKLPISISRYLFSASKKMRIGPDIEYMNVDSHVRDQFLDLLRRRGT